MDQELQTAIAEFVKPYIEDRHRILNIAAAVEKLSMTCPVDKERIADSLRKYAAPHGVTMLLKPVRQTP